MRSVEIQQSCRIFWPAYPKTKSLRAALVPGGLSPWGLDELVEQVERSLGPFLWGRHVLFAGGFKLSVRGNPRLCFRWLLSEVEATS